MGTYIDVGAWDPEYHSVSFNFYESGWRGINVEPEENSFLLLSSKRPQDINLRFFVSSMLGKTSFLSVANSGLSTGNPEIAEKLKRNKEMKISNLMVQNATLESIFGLLNEEQIHWLKIDVEGSEYDVINSWGQNEYRPWVLVIEATIPESKEMAEKKWEELLLARGYLFAYFDGLNDFYVHESHSDLIDSIQTPISIFDDVISFESYIRNEVIRKLYEKIEKDGLEITAEYLDKREVEAIANEISNNLVTRSQMNFEITSHEKSIKDHLNSEIAGYQKSIRELSDLLEKNKKELFAAVVELSNIKNSKLFRLCDPIRGFYFHFLNFSIQSKCHALFMRVIAIIVNNRKVKYMLLRFLPDRIIFKVKRIVFYSEKKSRSTLETSDADTPFIELENLLRNIRGL
jgi:FkbM family methyltransferase